ncbi:class E sortase [Streptomyces halstedii]|uniref:class E sortase n=1 Tax=Streptomyces TaxID=1883 RepID=UPI000805F2EB|nr:class E sortase [Streptomyces sp. OspMP-M45]MYR71189.1 class E sortase [Streptomyces sp. SID4925]SBV02292.1 sortase A [Streptomyces sp. OspMP-M45]
MTPARPGPDAGHQDPYARGPYGADGTFEAAVDQLADPLNDPLPGQHTPPWFRAEDAPEGGEGGPAAPPQGPPTAANPLEAAGEWYDPEGYQRDWYGSQGPEPAPQAPSQAIPHAREPHQARQAPEVHPPHQPREAFEAHPPHESREASEGRPSPQVTEARQPRQLPERPPPGRRADRPAAVPRTDPVTARMPVIVPGSEPFETRRPVVPAVPDETADPRPAGPRDADDDGDLGSPADGPVPETVPTGGRAERRRAAKGRGRRRPEPRPAAQTPGAQTPAGKPPVPMSRLEARRAARAAKDSPAVVASRVAGEVFITFGVLMLLFVTYQLWWTNVRADQIAGRETHKIQDEWAKGSRTPGAFEPGQGFAIMHIPKLDVVAPIAEGIDKEKVLDRGMVGHYAEGTLKTAMPSAEEGNFAVAGHRNTHGEPFRYINKLKPGDPIVVETQDAYYTYEMTSILPQTAPSNISVIKEVPEGSGFTAPGRYITLTTCTPEFTSTYRMIVWGKMVDERPRDKGKPDALVG